MVEDVTVESAESVLGGEGAAGGDMPLGVRDVTPEDAMTPEGFDLAGWIAGARPTRRAVTVYARGDLMARFDELSDQMRLNRMTGVDNGEVDAEAEALVRELYASALTVVVEARSEAAIDKACEGFDPEKDSLEYNLRAVACHIVEPAGFDVDLLRTFNEVSPVQASRIVAAIADADSKAPHVPAPFSVASLRSRDGRE